MNALAPVSADQVYAWLQEVPDPEIPVLSVVDLGVVRDVSWEDGACVVVITPTYSGCPAMREITQDIQQTLARHGVADVRAILERYEREGRKINAIDVRKPTLDDVFLHYTGHKNEAVDAESEQN